MAKQIWAFIAKMRGGKDTAGLYLQKHFGGKIVKFADPLYRMQEAICEIAGLPHDENTKHRGLLQYLGTEFGRAIDPDIWMNIMEKTMLTDPHEKLYITDVRFKNEFALMKKHNVITVKIIRPDAERIKFGAANESHVSETSLDDIPDSEFTYVIHNDGTIGDFHRKLLQAYKRSAIDLF